CATPALCATSARRLRAARPPAARPSTSRSRSSSSRGPSPTFPRNPPKPDKLLGMGATGVVTILFTDLVGSTELAAEVGDAAAGDVRRSHFATLRSVLDEKGGEEVKTLGDGLMASFTSAVGAVECAVAWERPVVAVPPSPTVTAATAGVFVGREAELDKLGDAWRQAAGGQLRTVLLGGEPGIGKTRLALQAAMSAHDEGATVLLGRCDEDTVVPYQPFFEALGHYVSVCPEDDLKEQVGAHGGELARLVPRLSERLPGVVPD